MLAKFGFLDTNVLGFSNILPSPPHTSAFIPTKTIHSPNKYLCKKLSLGKNADSSPSKKRLNKKLHSTCSTKWVSYDGRIPSLLHALNTIHDLDNALRQWEKTLSSREISAILKAQVSWQRALQIFEWFNKKGCYDLNVIHYNIMLWTLGRACKWGLVESLWGEMNAKGVAPVNSTYGTLIDAYNKGGLKEEALAWFQRMQSQGMEPDEVTMGIIVLLYKRAGEFRIAEEYFRRWIRGASFRLEVNHNFSVDEKGSHANVCLSSNTYNTLINTYGKGGQFRAVCETFARMIRQGITLNTVTLNLMIH